MDKIYKKFKAEGTIIIPGVDEQAYYLLYPYPIKKDDWMTDDMNMFYVAPYKGTPRHIVVKGPFLIDYWSSGQEIEVDTGGVETFEVFSEPKWLNELLKAEPASLAE